ISPAAPRSMNTRHSDTPVLQCGATLASTEFGVGLIVPPRRRRRCRRSRNMNASPRIIAFAIVTLLGFSAQVVRAQDAIRFPELYELLKTNLLGGGEEELNRAAVNGLLQQLRGRVNLVNDSGTTPAPETVSKAISATGFDRTYGYVRLTRLDAGAASNFATTCERLIATNRLKGLVIDLRFTAGTDYAAAIAVANCFFADSRPLMDWGQGWKNSSAKSNAISVPVAVLVNSQTGA